ncbi:MAG TPA: ABC transporter permease [Bacteroidales bacterium]|nr:ABC transporter permease [Bacteroidales bacterium]
MIRTYLITSYRFMVKGKTFTWLNIGGLTAGLMASFILLIFTMNEVSYDRYHQHADDIYRVVTTDNHGNLHALSAYSLASNLQSHFQEIKSVARIAWPYLITGSVFVKGTDVYYKESSFYCADTQFLRLFDVKMLRGDLAGCLKGSHSVIISDETARKYFKKENPIGRQLRIKTAGIEYDLKVTGVFESFPQNSTLQMDFISGMEVFPNLLSMLIDSTELARQLNFEPNVETFILLNHSENIYQITGKLHHFIQKKNTNATLTDLRFQPLCDIYLGSNQIIDMIHKKGNRSSMYIYLSLSLFVLLLAGINYSILSTARSALRYKEIGVRKVLGASRRALSTQILTESVLLTFLSFPVSYLLIGLAEPVLRWMFGYRVEIFSSETLILIPIFAGITIFIGLISGAYIAFYLSSLNPLQALKNKVFSHRKINLSRVFTVFQLLITISLLISVIMIYRQVHFCTHHSQGIDKNNLAILLYEPEEFTRYRELKKEISAIPGVIAVSGSSIIIPDFAVPTISAKSGNSGKEIKLEPIIVDSGFFQAMGISIIAGTDFDPADSMKSTYAYILNKEAAKVFNFTDITDASFGGFKVIGIVNDFNVHTMYDKINPVVFSYDPDALREVVIRYKEGAGPLVNARIEKIWKSLAPGQAFTSRDFSAETNRMYQKELVFEYVVLSFTILAFIIMGMGLFGLALLISERKTKEIAIRKIYGASNRHILSGLMKEFFIYSGIASIIAIPVTIILGRRWLNTFYYRVDMSWWIFVIAIASVTIFVSFIIVTRAIKVIKKNPVNVLKYE